MFDTNTLLTSGLLLGGITTILYTCKGYFITGIGKLKTKLIRSITIYDYDELFIVLENWLSEKHNNKRRNLEASYEQSRKVSSFVSGRPSPNKEQNGRSIYYKQEANFFIIKYKGKKIFFKLSKEKLEHATELRQALNFHYTLTCWRDREILSQLLEEITIEYNKTLSETGVKIYSTSYCDWYLSDIKNVKSLDKVILPKELKCDLVKDLTDWMNQEKWYNSLNIPYKRGYLFHGEPGTGKSTIVQSIATFTKRSIFYLNIASITSEGDLGIIFSNLTKKSILLIEDIDCYFDQRKPLNGVKISFSSLLNCLDGVGSKEDIITILTTNHIEKLDPALIRTGRIDRIIEIKKVGRVEIKSFFKMFYEVDEIEINTTTELPMSLVQSICLRNKNNIEKARFEIESLK